MDKIDNKYAGGTLDNKWNIDFRPDGDRGECVYCNQSFDINGNEGFIMGLLRHYTTHHSFVQGLAYVNHLYKNIDHDNTAEKKVAYKKLLDMKLLTQEEYDWAVGDL